MAFQKVEYEFPDEKGKKPEIEVEGSDAVEIDLSGKAAKESDPEPARTDDNNDDKLTKSKKGNVILVNSTARENLSGLS